MSNEVDLGNEPVKHLLFILAVPAIVSQLVNALYNMVDRMYIGHIADIGATALTGVGVCFPIIMIVSALHILSAWEAHLGQVSLWAEETEKQRKRYSATVFLLFWL